MTEMFHDLLTGQTELYWTKHIDTFERYTSLICSTFSLNFNITDYKLIQHTLILQTTIYVFKINVLFVKHVHQKTCVSLAEWMKIKNKNIK